MKTTTLTLYLVPKLLLWNGNLGEAGSRASRPSAFPNWSLGTRKMGLAFLIICCCFFANAAFAQSDSDKKKSKTSKKKQSELVFDDIVIEAIIEKPNIAILPTRRLKKLGEIDFINRSFAEELKAVPEKSFLFKGELEKPKKIDNIEKVLKKRKKGN
ncbi:hypothetical protein IIA28_05470 [candidate division KSB1 bacterium]|nr:hypothetical protein [candidate division KSB1 bacterium]